MASAVDSLLAKARAAERRGEPVIAQHAYVEVLERYPGNVRARTALAALDRALIPAYQALSPTYEELTQLVALYQGGRHAEALAFADQLLAHHAQCHFLLSTKGAIAGALGDSDMAIKAYLQALAIKPDYADAHYNLATTYEAINKHEEALGFYLRTVALRPDHAPSLTRLGQLYALRHDHDSAINALERALALDPADLGAWYALAERQRFKGLLASAIASYQRALALAPGREDGRVALEATRALAADWSSIDRLREVCNLGLSQQVVPNHPMLGIDPDPARALVRARTTASAIAATVGKAAPLVPPPACSRRTHSGGLLFGRFSQSRDDVPDAGTVSRTRSLAVCDPCLFLWRRPQW